MLGRRRVKWIVIMVLVMLIAGVVSAQAALLWMQPVTHGSVSWSTGQPGECPGFEPTPETSHCAAVPFDPGAPVSLGFTVRNTGPLPLTVVSMDSFGTQSAGMLAEMHPVLPPQIWPGVEFPVDETRPFEPIAIGRQEEGALQLLGHIRECDAVRGYYTPGTALIITHAHLRVRWLLLGREVQVPLRQALRIESPAEGQCP